MWATSVTHRHCTLYSNDSCFGLKWRALDRFLSLSAYAPGVTITPVCRNHIFHQLCVTENGEIRTIRKGTMTVRIPSLCLLILFMAFQACVARDHGSWIKTLDEKAVSFERDTAERHNILGTYMLTPDGVYTCGYGQLEWQAPPRQTRPRGFGTFNPVGGKPLWLHVDDTTLILQHEGAEREEIGGIGYLAAYWMARYHNFIDQRTANAEWWR